MLVYMKVDNISDVGLAPHADWMLLKDCTFEFRSSDSDEDGTEREPVKIVKLSDRGSTKLLAWMQQEDERQVTIEFCLRPGEVDEDLYILSLALQNTTMLDYSAQFSSDAVEETFKLKYKKVTIEYWEKQPTERWKESSSFEL